MYVGNLSYSVTEDELRSMFTEYGDVVSAKLIMDRETGRSKGFGFVEYRHPEDAKRAATHRSPPCLFGQKLRVQLSLIHI